MTDQIDNSNYKNEILYFTGLLSCFIASLLLHWIWYPVIFIIWMGYIIIYEKIKLLKASFYIIITIFFIGSFIKAIVLSFIPNYEIVLFNGNKEEIVISINNRNYELKSKELFEKTLYSSEIKITSFSKEDSLMNINLLEGTNFFVYGNSHGLYLERVFYTGQEKYSLYKKTRRIYNRKHFYDNFKLYKRGYAPSRIPVGLFGKNTPEVYIYSISGI